MTGINSIIRYCNPAAKGFSSFEKFGQISTLGKCCAVAAAIFGAILGLGFGGVGAFRLTVERFSRGSTQESKLTDEEDKPRLEGYGLGKELGTNIWQEGKGCFGRVYIAIINGQEESSQVIKVPKWQESGAGVAEFAAAQNESDLLKKLNPGNDVFGLQKCIEKVELKDGLVGYIGPRYTMDLAQAIGESKVQSKEHKLTIAHGMMSGLHYLHSKWVIHRDIKLANIFLDLPQGGQPIPYLADLGRSVDFSDGDFPELDHVPSLVPRSLDSASESFIRDYKMFSQIRRKATSEYHQEAFEMMRKVDACALSVSIFKCVLGRDEFLFEIERRSEADKKAQFQTVFNEEVSGHLAATLQNGGEAAYRLQEMVDQTKPLS